MRGVSTMFFTIHHQQVELRIYAKPNAKRTALLSVDDRGLHISLHAKPQDGEANKELISFLSDTFDIPKTQIKLLSGDASRYKRVMLPLNAKVQNFLNTMKF